MPLDTLEIALAGRMVQVCQAAEPLHLVLKNATKNPA